MYSFRNISVSWLAAGAVIAAALLTPATATAQDQATQATASAPATVESSVPRAPSAEQALPGPRLAPRWEPVAPLLPGETRERTVNASAARANTITIPVVTLLLGIIILILLVD